MLTGGGGGAATMSLPPHVVTWVVGIYNEPSLSPSLMIITYSSSDFHSSTNCGHSQPLSKS